MSVNEPGRLPPESDERDLDHDIDAPEGYDVGRLERVLSRSAALLGMATLAIVVLLNPGAGLPVVWPVAVVGLLALAKVVVLVAGVRARWPAWPAVLAELGALGVVAFIVTSSRALDLWALSVVVVLLGTAAFLRRRTLSRPD